MTTPKQPATEARRARIAQRLADLMAERGFAVPDRVEQWTAPYEDAAAILEKLWPAIVGEGRERALSDIPGWALNDGITRWFDKEKREQPATEDTEMTTPKQPATEDWRGKWDRIGSRQDRLAYLRTYWPDLMDAIEAEAMTDTPKQPATEAWLDAIRDEVRLAVIDGDADDCSSADCIADAVYEIVRTRLPAIEAWADERRKVGLLADDAVKAVDRWLASDEPEKRLSGEAAGPFVRPHVQAILAALREQPAIEEAGE